jgi:hypothetical protein
MPAGECGVARLRELLIKDCPRFDSWHDPCRAYYVGLNEWWEEQPLYLPNADIYETLLPVFQVILMLRGLSREQAAKRAPTVAISAAKGIKIAKPAITNLHDSVAHAHAENGLLGPRSHLIIDCMFLWQERKSR